MNHEVAVVMYFPGDLLLKINIRINILFTLQLCTILKSSYNHRKVPENDNGQLGNCLSCLDHLNLKARGQATPATPDLHPPPCVDADMYTRILSYAEETSQKGQNTTSCPKYSDTEEQIDDLQSFF